MQRRVASSDTRNNIYEQAIAQNRATMNKAQSQTRQQQHSAGIKDMNRSLGFAKGMRQQHSGFLQDAANLLTVGGEQKKEKDPMRYTGQKAA